MTPEELGARFAGVGGEATVSGGGAFGRATVRVEPARWVDALTFARDELGCDFFDWLSAVDELDQGFTVVAHLWSTSQRHGVLLQTVAPVEAPAVPSVVAVYPGAAWHERETHEMFGIDFPGHPGELRPLLLPPEFIGYPLRKQFILASRVAKPWPGAKEPGESHDSGAARRAPMRPPGVPAPGEWGPLSASEAAAAPRPARRGPAVEGGAESGDAGSRGAESGDAGSRGAESGGAGSRGAGSGGAESGGAGPGAGGEG